jgi:two-component system sensor histidine kinase/response regulator
VKNIFLIEDSVDDVCLFQRAVKKAGIPLDIRVAEDGREAIDFLIRLGHSPDESKICWWPDLVLLDLNLPEIGGLEVLEWIRQRSFSPPLNVVVLTSSEAPGHIQAALKAGAHSFIVKPTNPAELLPRVRPFLNVGSVTARLDHFGEGNDEMLCALAHNLKSMIGGILMDAEILRDRVQTLKDPRVGELAENILQSSSRTLRFVRQFLANSAADHGVTLKLERVSLADSAAQIVQEYQETAKRKDLTLHLVLAGDETFIRADPTALYQVLDNLLSNAVKFSPLGKEILVAVRPIAKAVEFSVQDQGPGFSESDQPLLFKRFTRLSANPTAGEPSTGLGLSIVKKMTAAMGGTVECESQPDQGTIFRVRFPRAPEEENEPGEIEPRSATPGVQSAPPTSS